MAKPTAILQVLALNGSEIVLSLNDGRTIVFTLAQLLNLPHETISSNPAD